MKTKRTFILGIVFGCLLLSAMPSWAYYNPSSGRWLNRDPSHEKGGINLFAFCKNNPRNNIDTDGRFILGPVEPEFSALLNEMADWIAIEAEALAAGDAAAAATARVFVEAFSKQAMRAIIAETGGAAAAGEAGFVSAELLGTMGSVATGVGIGMGLGLVFVYVENQACDAVGAMIKKANDINSAIIDYWSDPDTR